jgi:ABC-type bacteriocin/lantibiotic exporter with double-glycine peptidase domain
MYEEASQVANDAIGSIRTVASFCSEKKVMDVYEKKCEGPMKQGVRLGVVSGAGFGASFVVMFFTNALIFYVGAHLVKNGKATFEEVFKVSFQLLPTFLLSSSMPVLRSNSKISLFAGVLCFNNLSSRGFTVYWHGS